MTGNTINLYSPVDEEDFDVHTQRCECIIQSTIEMTVHIVTLRLVYNNNSEDLSAIHKTLNITGYGQDGTITTWLPTTNNILGATVINKLTGSVSLTFVKDRNLVKAEFHLLLIGKQFCRLFALHIIQFYFNYAHHWNFYNTIKCC